MKRGGGGGVRAMEGNSMKRWMEEGLDEIER